MIEDKIYFEKQRLFSNMCAVHAVNNLLGASYFSENTFNQICQILEKETRQLGIQVKNKHFIGGDFDANVIIKALQNFKLTIKWVDSRKTYKYQYEPGTMLRGYIVNVKQQQSKIKSFFKLSGRHWICLKRSGMNWFLLDSKKQGVEQIEDIDLQLRRLLTQGGQVIQVMEDVRQEETEWHDIKQGKIEQANGYYQKGYMMGSQQQQVPINSKQQERCMKDNNNQPQDQVDSRKDNVEYAHKLTQKQHEIQQLWEQNELNEIKQNIPTG